MVCIGSRNVLCNEIFKASVIIESAFVYYCPTLCVSEVFAVARVSVCLSGTSVAYQIGQLLYTSRTRQFFDIQVYHYGGIFRLMPNCTTFPIRPMSCMMTKLHATLSHGHRSTCDTGLNERARRADSLIIVTHAHVHAPGPIMSYTRITQ